ncbi:hypothetical protein [Microvirga roseola]|uniref:hypothetical protein n=1 Tax=Microvirga roseola TaxID=2883126 RepID=UPI001E315D8A|nr:hypothetical protein [Microvirga roseola]
MRRSKAKANNPPKQIKAAAQNSTEHADLYEAALKDKVSSIKSVAATEQLSPELEWTEAVAPIKGGAAMLVQDRVRTNSKRGLNAAQRRAKRAGMPVSLRRGERWKRRLPEVCW